MTCLDMHLGYNILAALLSDLKHRLVALVMVVICCFFLAESRAWSFASRPYPASQEQMEKDLEEVASALLKQLLTAEEGHLGDVLAMIDCFHQLRMISSLPMHSPYFVYRQKNAGYEVASSELEELFQLACGGGGGVSPRPPARPSPPKPKIPKKALPAGIVGGALYIDQTRSDWAYEKLKDRQTKAALERRIEEAIEIKNNTQLADEEKEEIISTYIEHAHTKNNEFKRRTRCPKKAINNLNIDYIRSKC